MNGERILKTTEETTKSQEDLEAVDAIKVAGSLTLRAAVPEATAAYGVKVSNSARISRSTATYRRGGHGFVRHPASYN